MTKSTKKTQTASRPPVDALQYEKLALSAFGACDRQIRQLRTLIDLAASVTRCPATTVEEGRRERNLLEHLLYTVEQYQQEVECDRDLYQVIALDAKGLLITVSPPNLRRSFFQMLRRWDAMQGKRQPKLRRTKL
ncbi:hypothetical protein [Paraburkholderia sediminicola]|uniref:hypothetical protein n=1 Tax=Paraburkholderia sediminicola TaxID=458836 RepID=UPI0038B76610